ncbi:uncharacterized protein LOC129599329 [Paramacrobiotus metropolitanus]|uniref:uncharacterized protein LOC129599329 n=1 Tax=Paramacrobiotus metropolitanus TaxID=2943436 RepID=UPI0024460B88|nr:uncharacterized protein LOC129599329 [Paramacrobiotus metropolitanus]
MDVADGITGFGLKCCLSYGASDCIGNSKSVYKATVLECESPSDVRFLAVKLISMTPESAAEEELMEQCKRLIALNDENVVVYRNVTIRVTKMKGYAAFGMDYHLGGSLRDTMVRYERERRKLAVAKLYNWSEQMASGLKYLHGPQQNIIHGHLKPSCILMELLPNKQMRLRIGGLNRCIALPIPQKTLPDLPRIRDNMRMQIGKSTSLYRSPEMAHNVNPDTEVTFGPETDIWSLGHIILELAECCYGEKNPQSSRDAGDRVDAADQDLSWMWRLVRTAEGYIPTPSKSVPNEFRKEIIEVCLQSDCRSRHSAAMLHKTLMGASTVAQNRQLNGTTWLANLEENVVASEDGQMDGAENAREMTAHETMHPIVEEVGGPCEFKAAFPECFIGQGAFGSVFKATVTRFSYQVNGSHVNYLGPSTVAVKSLRVDSEKRRQLSEPAALCKEKERWEALIKLRHSYLVSYHKFILTLWKDNARTDILMNCCSAGDLGDLIQKYHKHKNVLNIPSMITMASHLASGLDFLNENNFIHGDLKPGNIFINGRTGPKGCCMLVIGDLDNAARIHNGRIDKTALRGFQYTTAYASPELLKAVALQACEQSLQRSDVWSLGCVLLDLANCCYLIQDKMYYKAADPCDKIPDNAHDLMLKIIEGYTPYISEQIAEIQAGLIRSCLTVKCDQRITAGQLWKKLRTIINKYSEDVREKTFGRNRVIVNSVEDGLSDPFSAEQQPWFYWLGK